MRLIFAAIVILAENFGGRSFDTAPIPKRIGMVLTLSGSFAAAGEDCRQGIEAGIKEGRKHPLIEPVFADSKNDPTAAISEFRRLVETESVAAVYTHRGPIGMSLNPISRKAEIPLLGAVGNKAFAGENRFAIQVWPRSDDEGRFLADEFIKRGLKRAALLYTEDDWTAATANGFRERFSERGGTLAFDQSVLLAETDFRTLVLQLRGKDVQAVYANVLLPQIPLFIRQARELGLGKEIFCNFYVSKKEVLDAAGAPALEGVRYVEMNTDLPALKAALGLPEGEVPPGLTVASYAAAVLLSQAAAESGAAASPLEFREALLRQKEIRTKDAVYAIEDRYVKFPLAVKVLRSGKGVRE